MEIRFVNHASFVCEAGGLQIMCDPWLHGSAFNNGWDLVSDTRFRTSDFEGIDYIWFSHEHPDHFSPPVLSGIPEPVRQRIRVLYKETPDKKVVRFCQKLGFTTRELKAGETLDLGQGVTLQCRAVPLYDSWLLIRSPRFTVLNLNDVVVRGTASLRRLKREVGRVDVLFTQFNYAAWRGNREDTRLRVVDAQRKLEIMRDQIEVLEPRFTVPFASFSYFSHEENSFTNDAANHPSTAVQAIQRTASQPILLYPGDRWAIGAAHDNGAANDRYRSDYESIPTRPLRKAPRVGIEELKRSAEGYIARIAAENDRRTVALIRRVPILGLLRPIEIFLWDLDLLVRFSFDRGLEEIATRRSDYKLSMGSDSLNVVFKHAWGIDTLTVNGRFAADAGGVKQLVGTFGVDALNNAGVKLSPSILVDYKTVSFLGKIVLQKLWALRRQQGAAPSAEL